MTRQVDTDVLVVGGGLGGVAAAWAAAEAGWRVVLTEETDWLGGQLTAQGVPPDEHPWIEAFGATARYRRLRNAIRDHYRAHYPLRPESLALRHLNPGAGRVSALCHEPRVAAAVIDATLDRFGQDGRLTTLREHRIVGADVGPDDVVASVTLRDLTRDELVTVTAPYVLDATETGELLPLAHVEHVTGFESRGETGEALAPDHSQPLNMQAATWCFAVEYRPGENHTIDRPATYSRWRAARPDYWPGPQFGWVVPHPHDRQDRIHSFDPNPDDQPGSIRADQSRNPGSDELWCFRRILARNHFRPGAYASDVTLVNWPMIDYVDGPLFGTDPALAQRHHQGTRQMSESFLYWLQTEAPRPDGGTGYPGLRPRPDVMGTADGFAKAPYIRESRRIVAQYRVTAGDVAVAERGPAGAVSYPDSCGVGAYRIDLHPSTGGDNYIDVPAHPFEIPLGALLPVRVRNVVAAAKNIGTTHITNGCFRLHPVEWNVGEAAGLLAAYCLQTGCMPHQVRNDPRHLGEYQRLLELDGVENRWPRIRPW